MYVCTESLFYFIFNLSLFYLVHRLHSAPSKSILLAASNIREYPSCKHLGDSQININDHFAVYIPKTNNVPYQKITSSYIRIYDYTGVAGTSFNMDAEIHLKLSQQHSDECKASHFHTAFKGTASVDLNSDKHVYIHFGGLMQKVTNSSLWENGMSFMIVFKKKEEGEGIFNNGTTNLYHITHTEHSEMFCNYFVILKIPDAMSS